MPTEHRFGFKTNPSGDRTKPLEYFGGPDPTEPAEWKYFTHDQIQFVCPDGPFQLDLKLIHPVTGADLPAETVAPFERDGSNAERIHFESGKEAEPDSLLDPSDVPGRRVFKTGTVTVRTPQSAGIVPTGTGFVARYRYTVRLRIGNTLIEDMNQTGEWNHC